MSDGNVDVSMLLPIFKKIPLFASLDDKLHHTIMEHIVLMYYPANYILFKEGDIGDALYIIKNGQVVIYHEPKEAGDLPDKVADMTNNAFFGEMALVSSDPRNASAKTLADSEIFILSKDDFSKLLNSNPELAEQVSATMVSRIKENQKEQT